MCSDSSTTTRSSAAAASRGPASSARTEELPRILAGTEPDIVFVTIPDAPREVLDAIVEACAELEVTCRFVRRELDLEPHVAYGAASE